MVTVYVPSTGIHTDHPAITTCHQSCFHSLIMSQIGICNACSVIKNSARGDPGHSVQI